MIITFTYLLTVPVLRKIAKINGIKHISSFSKEKLLICLNTYKRVLPIQRQFRNKSIVDKHCPISFEKLKYPFISIKSSSKFNYYDFDTFVKYLSSTRDFRDPLTREVISDTKIREVNSIINYYYGKKSAKLLWSDSMAKKLEFTTTIECINMLVNDIMITKRLTIDYIYTVVIPQFMYYFQILIDNHLSSAREIINRCLSITDRHECINKYLIIDNICKIKEINELP